MRNTPQITSETDISKIFDYLKEYELSGYTMGEYDKATNIFTCELCDVPARWMSIDEFKKYDMNPNCYELPIAGGDIIKGIQIDGNFKSFTLFQYDWLGSNRTIIAHSDGHPYELTTSLFLPFPQSGIPYIQIGSAMYIEFIPLPGIKSECSIGFGFLDTKTRKLMNTIDNSGRGLSVIHKSGQKYTVFGMDNFGHSVNKFAPDNTNKYFN